MQVCVAHLHRDKECTLVLDSATVLKNRLLDSLNMRAPLCPRGALPPSPGAAHCTPLAERESGGWRRRHHRSPLHPADERASRGREVAKVL